MFHYVPMFFDRSCYDHCRNIPSHDFYKPRTSKDTLLVGSNNTRMAPLIHAIRRVWGCFNVFDVILKQPAVFFDEKTRLITSLPLSDLWWGFNASRLSLAPHMWHIPVQKKRRPPPGQKSESKAVSFFTDRCASMPVVIRFLNGISRVLSHQITDWSACGGDKTRNALFCWLELAMLLNGDWILWIPMRANETCVNPVFIALILFERPNDYISWLIQVHGLSFSSQV